MINTEIYNSTDSKIIEGMEQVFESVTSTMGAAGRNVIIKTPSGKITSTKDGVTVAKNIKFKDDLKQIGASILLEAADNVNTNVGDGTTTTIALAFSLIEMYLKNYNPKLNSYNIKKILDTYKHRIISELSKIKEEANSKDKIQQIATISANNDPVIGELIAKAIDYVGEDGGVIVEKGYLDTHSLEIVNGMKLEEGLISPVFLFNGQKKLEIDKPYYVIYDGEISKVSEVIGFLEFVAAQKNKSIVFIAHNITGQALATLIMNNQQGILNCVGIKAPSYGTQRTKILEDIATVTGATVIPKEIGLEKKSFGKVYKTYSEVLGQSEKFTSNLTESYIIEGKGNLDEIKARIENLKEEQSGDISDYQKMNIYKRIANLSSKIAVIKIGGNNELEVEEIKYRIEDALHATKWAIKEGFIEGGGIPLMSLSEKLKSLLKPQSEEEQLAFKMVYQSLRRPFSIIVENSGYNTEVVWDKIQRKRNVTGFDVKEKRFVNLKEEGIIDSFAVLKEAINVSFSVASTFITTKNVLIQTEDKQES